MRILRTVLATVLITIQAVFEVVLLGALVTEADVSGGGPGLARPFAPAPPGGGA
ncbi:MAG TPA: hypothetical protein VGO28_08565 [Acidimicrobiia bacterium]